MKIIKKIITSILIILLGFLLIFLLIIYLNHDNLSKYLISQLNDKLNTKLKIEEVNFSLIKGFPNATFEFKKVTINSSNDFILSNNNTNKILLLRANSIILNFNILSLLQKKINLKKIVVSDGYINIYKDVKDKYNFNIIKSDSLSKKRFLINLKRLKFNNIILSYIDLKDTLKIEMCLKRVLLNLSLKEKDYSAKVKIQLSLFNIINKNDWIFKSKNIKSNITLHYDKKNLYFACNYINIDNNIGNFSGLYNLNKKLIDINYLIKCQSIKNISTIIKIKMTYEFDARIILYGVFKWSPSYKYPVLNGILKITHGKFKLNNNVTFNKIQGMLNVFIKSSFDLNQSYINVNNLNLTIDSMNVNASGKLINLLNPYIDALIDVKGPVKELNKHLQSKISINSGIIALNLEFFGFISNNLIDNKLINFTYNGKLSFSDISLTVNNRTHFENAAGDIDFNNNKLTIKYLNFIYDSNYFKYSGKVMNLSRFLYRNNENLYINGKLYLPSLMLRNNKKDTFNYFIPKKVELNIELITDQLIYNSHVFSNIKAYIIKRSDSIHLTNVYFETLEGKGKINEIFISGNDNKFNIKSTGLLENINIKNLFAQYRDFGQSFISYKNLSGSLNVNFVLSAQMDNQFQLEKNNFDLYANIVLSKGNLVNFEPIQELSKFIDINELKNVKFSTLKNTIHIKNGLIKIPLMNVYSSACNLTIFGTHSFENEFEYHIKIELSEILSKKYKKKFPENEFNNTYEDDEVKKNLFIKLSGKNNNYKKSYDKSEAIKNFKKNLIKEKQNLKSIFKEEFYKKQNDSLLLYEKNNKKQYKKVYFTDDTSTKIEPFKTNEIKKQKKITLEWKDE
jgi:hypothetical protein